MTRKLILVVDDDTGVLTTISNLLKSKGYGVACALSAEQALEIVTTMILPDLLIVDFKMPRMNGVQLLEEIRAKGVHVPAMIISGYLGDLKHMPEVEVVIPKPPDPEKLLAEVARILGSDPLTSVEGFPMHGTIKSTNCDLGDCSITFTDDSVHAVEDDADVTLNGKPAELADLKAGDKVKLSGDPATSVTATR